MYRDVVTQPAPATVAASRLPLAGDAYAVAFDTAHGVGVAFTDDLTGVGTGCAVARDGELIRGNETTETMTTKESVK